MFEWLWSKGDARRATGKGEEIVVVLGAGVVGLTTALTLARRGYKNIHVVAKHMPADFDVEYTSIWAGADWDPVSEKGTREAGWDIITWNEFIKLASECPGAGIWLKDKKSYYRNVDRKPEDLHLWYKDLVMDYKLLDKSCVPGFADWGSNCLEHDVKFHRNTISHIREAFSVVDSSTGAAVVINCTGLQSLNLGGVEDKNMVPILGQLVIVANEADGLYSVSSDADLPMDDAIGECCYVIPRPAGGGTAIGGCRNLGSWSTEPNLAISERLMKRAVTVAPSLVPLGAGIEALRVVRHQVGWRPFRKGGPRVEREMIADKEMGPLQVVHAYGMGGFGFQSSYGVGALVADLVGQSLAEKM